MVEIHPSLQDFNDQVTQSKQSNVKFVDNALQTSLESLAIEDHEAHLTKI